MEGSVIVDGLNVDLALVDGKVVEAIPQSRTEPSQAGGSFSKTATCSQKWKVSLAHVTMMVSVLYCNIAALQLNAFRMLQQLVAVAAQLSINMVVRV